MVLDPIHIQMKPPINHAALAQIDSAFESLLENANIMKDGAICIDRYARAGLRVMWVLKQNISYDFNDYSTQLFQNLDKVSSSPTWRRLAHASHGLLSGLRDFTAVKNDERAGCLDSLLSTAIVNVNKKLGGTRSTDASVHDGHARYQHLVRMQIEAYAPDVIIACMIGTNENLKPVVESLHHAYTGESEYRIRGNSKPASADVAWTKSGNKVFLWAYHPSYTHVSDSDYFDGIMSAYDEALNR